MGDYLGRVRLDCLGHRAGVEHIPAGAIDPQVNSVNVERRQLRHEIFGCHAAVPVLADDVVEVDGRLAGLADDPKLALGRLVILEELDQVHRTEPLGVWPASGWQSKSRVCRRPGQEAGS
ncbi:hypothetical protein D3C81_1874720 [compost metagenome]